MFSFVWWSEKKGRGSVLSLPLHKRSGWGKYLSTTCLPQGDRRTQETPEPGLARPKKKKLGSAVALHRSAARPSRRQGSGLRERQAAAGRGRAPGAEPGNTRCRKRHVTVTPQKQRALRAAPRSGWLIGPAPSAHCGPALPPDRHWAREARDPTKIRARERESPGERGRGARSARARRRAKGREGAGGAISGQARPQGDEGAAVLPTAPANSPEDFCDGVRQALPVTPGLGG